MKKLILGLLLLVCFNGWGQKQQQQIQDLRKGQRVITDSVTQYDQADRIYGNLQRLIPTHKLFNRLLLQDTLKSVVWNTDSIRKNKEYGATADHAYGLMYEMRLMSFDTSSVPSRMEVMHNAMDYMGEFQFEEDECHYPIGIFDYKYNSMDEDRNRKNGNINLKDSMYRPQSRQLELKERKATLVAPLFDLYGSQRMAIIFRKENFYSNYRNVDEIKSILIRYDGKRKSLQFGETFYFTPQDEKNQKFHVKLTYKDGSTYTAFFTIRTPYLSLGNKEENHSKKSKFKCFKSGEISQEVGAFGGRKLKLQWCLQPRCGWNGRIYKPYILITGYRPPFSGQDYGTTWQYYNEEHNNMLSDLRNNNYDVFIVKFNMQWRYDKLGLIEQSNLLTRFIVWVNEQKGGQASGQENIIQGSSMGASVARLTLLRMEKKHFENPNYPNHHTRLNIAYDGNFYGANLPLSYQAQIYSAYLHPAFGIFSGPTSGGLSHFLSAYLFMTLNQKATKDLLTYHIAAYNPLMFLFNNINYINYQPTYHPSRGNYLNAINTANNNYASTDGHTNFIPMPNAPRNIAISLGHYNEANNVSNPNKFKDAGSYWRSMNFGLWEYKLGVAKYMSGNETFKLFKRKKFGFFGIGSVDQELHVNKMREVDNASGSYLGGAGNIISVADWTYFFWLTLGEDLFTWSWNARSLFTHKSVITALAINKDKWPTNGGMTMDLKSMGLMFVERNHTVSNQDESDYYGYPNLGRPNDHFEVTPFEAIFCGPHIQPHIRLNKASSEYVDSLKQFIMREVEPWYLELQNMHIGAQARPNYRYYSFRRAKHRIIVGANVTPKTDPGEYTVEPNGKLTLHAGDTIVIKPGVYFKPGSIVHIKPVYKSCSNANAMPVSGNNYTDDNSSFTSFSTETTALKTEILQQDKSFKLYPNPATSRVTIEGTAGILANRITIYNLEGKSMLSESPNQSNFNINVDGLKPGVYFVKINSANKVFNYKILVK